MKRKLEWHENARWLYGPLGQMHAQWLEDDGGASVHSEDAGLSGEPHQFNPRTACSACVMMVRSVYLPVGTPRNDEPTPARLIQERYDRLLSLPPTHTITSGVIMSWWPELSRDAAQQLLFRAVKRGVLIRSGVGEYVRPQETQAA